MIDRLCYRCFALYCKDRALNADIVLLEASIMLFGPDREDRADNDDLGALVSA